MDKKIRIAVIPAAGKGNRIAELPLTKILPKPMLPLLNKPIAEHIVDWLKKSGVEEIYFIVSFKKEIFKDYFGDGKDFGLKINYLDCPDPNNIGGLADGVKLAQPFITEPFWVVLGDDFTSPFVPEKMAEIFFAKKALVVEAVVREENPESLKRTCSVNLGKDGKILDIMEKPESPEWKIRGCGVYIFDPVVFDFIRETPAENGKKDITRTIQIMAQKTGRAFGFKVEKNININTLNDLNRATLTVLKRI